MNCPVCKMAPLDEQALDTNLNAHKCRQCGGCWVAGKDYWQWLDGHGAAGPEKPPEEGLPLEAHDSGPAKLCPQCGRFLIRFKVGRGTGFCLDHCGSCEGIWFDANKWEILKSRNLHTAVHLVVSSDWQAQVVRQERQKAHEQILLQKLGPADLAEIKRIKAWIDAHPKRSELYAFLGNQLDESSGRADRGLQSSARPPARTRGPISS